LNEGAAGKAMWDGDNALTYLILGAVGSSVNHAGAWSRNPKGVFRSIARSIAALGPPNALES